MKRRKAITSICCIFLAFSFLLVPALATAAPDDLDHGLASDEQRGGGGRIGDNVRILNGNMIESRQDLRFPSPNTLGLTLEAFYNSRKSRQGVLGYGWSHTYEAYLDPAFHVGTETYLKIVDGTGRAHYFLKPPPAPMKGPSMNGLGWCRIRANMSGRG